MFAILALMASASSDQSPKLLGTEADYFRRADYPTDASDDGVSGDVSVILDVDAGGRVAKCTVEVASGSASLDNATCRIAVEKMVFEPARTAAGRATTGIYRMTVKWAQPPVPGGPHPLRIAFEVQDGHILSSKCWIGLRSRRSRFHAALYCRTRR